LPTKDMLVCWTRSRLTKFRYDICVEQKHQIRSISLDVTQAWGSKSNFGVSSGILRSSTMSSLAGELVVLVNAEQDEAEPTSVGDKDGPFRAAFARGTLPD